MRNGHGVLDERMHGRVLRLHLCPREYAMRPRQFLVHSWFLLLEPTDVQSQVRRAGLALARPALSGLTPATVLMATARYDFGHRRAVALPPENYCFWAIPNGDPGRIMTADSLDDGAGV